MRATIGNGRAPSPRPVQFFELRGNRAIRFGDWRAVAMRHCGTLQEESRWMLSDTSRDFSEATDLSARYPGRLKIMQALWLREAMKCSTPALGGYSEAICNYSRYDDDFVKHTS